MNRSKIVRQWAGRLVLALLALEAVYLIGANLFLHQAWGARLINRRPEKVRVEWQRGWTFWPGRFELRGLQLEGQSRRVAWAVDLDAARVRLQTWALLGRRVDISHLTGHGLRAVIDPNAPMAPGAAASEGDKSSAGRRSADRAGRRPWQIRLAAIDLDEFRQLGIGDFQLLGDGRFQGRLEVTPRGPIWIERGALQFGTGEIRLRDKSLAELESLALDVRGEPFNPREARGIAALRAFSGTLEAVAARADLDFLDYYFRGSPVAIAGQGDLRLDLGLEHGVLMPASKLHGQADLRLRYLDHEARGRGRITAAVDPGEAPQATVALDFDDFEMGLLGAANAHVHGQGLHFRATTRELDLVTLEPKLQATLELPESEIPDLRAYNAYLPTSTGIAILAGRGLIHSAMELDTERGRAAGEFGLTGEDVEVRLGDLDLRAELDLRARVRDGDLDQLRFDLSGTELDLDKVHVLRGRWQDPVAWWTKIKLITGEVDLDQPLALEAEMTAQARDSSLLFALAAQDQGPRWLERRLRIDDITSQAHLSLTPEAIRVRDLSLAGEGVEAQAHLRFAQERLEGVVFCKVGPLSAAVEIQNQERDWQLVRSRRWYQKRRARLPW